MNTSIINPTITLDWLRANFTGKGVEVAIIDSGIDAAHPDLAGKVIRGCIVGKDAEGQPECTEIPGEESTDSFGHGTAVAGIINGLAPAANLINVKVLNQYNSCTGDILIEGIRWALDQNIKLINMSLATLKEKYFAELNQLCERAYEQDAILVISKRNTGGLGCPAMFSSVISVESGDYADPVRVRYKNSNLIEIDAQGTDVTVPAPGGGYAVQSGTSFATPQAAGLVALMLEMNPGLLTPEAKAIFKAFSN